MTATICPEYNLCNFGDSSGIEMTHVIMYRSEVHYTTRPNAYRHALLITRFGFFSNTHYNQVHKIK